MANESVETGMQHLHMRHDDHENRISVVEKQLEVIDENGKDMRRALDLGFERVFKALDTNAHEAHAQRAEIHRRIDDHEKDSKITWPIIFALVSTIIIVGGVLVGYVNLAIKPLNALVIASNDACHREMELRSDICNAHRYHIERALELRSKRIREQ